MAAVNPFKFYWTSGMVSALLNAVKEYKIAMGFKTLTLMLINKRQYKGVSSIFSEKYEAKYFGDKLNKD